MVIAVLRPELKVAVCDSVGKKARAVENIVQQLGLRNITLWGNSTGGRVVQALDMRDQALAARAAQLLRRRTLGVELEARLAGARDQASARAPEQHVAGAELLSDALEHQAGRGVGHAGELAGGGPGLVGQVVGQGVQRGAAQAQAGV